MGKTAYDVSKWCRFKYLKNERFIVVFENQTRQSKRIMNCIFVLFVCVYNNKTTANKNSNVFLMDIINLINFCSILHIYCIKLRVEFCKMIITEIKKSSS